MPLLTQVGRRRLPALFMLTSIYVALLLGAVTMVVPALIMLSGSVSNAWDYDRYHLWPRWLWNRDERHLKFVTEKYLGLPSQFPREPSLLASAYELPQSWSVLREQYHETDVASVVKLLQQPQSDVQLKNLHEDYRAWLEQIDPQLTLPMFARLTIPRYRVFLQERYQALAAQADPQLRGQELEKAALEVMAQRWQEARFTDFDAVEMTLEVSQPIHQRNWMPAPDEVRLQDYFDFLRTLPADERVPITEAYLWLRFLETQVGDAITFKRLTGLRVDSLAQVRLPEAEPPNPELARLRREFLHAHWPLWLVKLPDSMASDWHSFLRQRTHDIERFNAMVRASYSSFDDVPFIGTAPVRALERNFWRDYLKQLPPQTIAEHRISAERSFREHLRQQLQIAGSSEPSAQVRKLREQFGLDVTSLEDVRLPLAQVDAAQFDAQSSVWVWRFLTLNYVQVWEYMGSHSRAIFNTFVLVLLSIVSTLTVNPLAAYALSRYPMRSGSKVLLFLLATMAFPAEVSMIPSFLLLRDLNLLNTFAALILPGLANGFGIFLLKGFFDSLPRELYEAASIDGAGEFTVFTRITLPLSGPILAYQSLMAFLGAYGGFMWAFLVCQDSSMWTLMVWIYQFQQSARTMPYTVMAAFVLASIPTLVVFILCQRVILRGIVIPAMK